MLRKMDEELWAAEQPGRAYGVELGERTTVVRLAADELVVHVPAVNSEPLRQALAELGTVRYLCAPNLRCCDHLAQWLDAYPDAELLAAPGVASQQPGLERLVELGSEPVAAFAGQLDHLLFEGIPTLNEVALVHRPSRTLLLADLACIVPRRASLVTRAYLRLSLGGRRLGPTRDLRWLVTDRRAAAQSVERILNWDFERVVVRHGDVLEQGGKRALRKAYDWLRTEPQWWQ